MLHVLHCVSSALKHHEPVVTRLVRPRQTRSQPEHEVLNTTSGRRNFVYQQSVIILHALSHQLPPKQPRPSRIVAVPGQLNPGQLPRSPTRNRIGRNAHGNQPSVSASVSSSSVPAFASSSSSTVLRLSHQSPPKQPRPRQAVAVPGQLNPGQLQPDPTRIPKKRERPGLSTFII